MWRGWGLGRLAGWKGSSAVSESIVDPRKEAARIEVELFGWLGGRLREILGPPSPE